MEGFRTSNMMLPLRPLMAAFTTPTTLFGLNFGITDNPSSLLNKVQPPRIPHLTPCEIMDSQPYHQIPRSMSRMASVDQMQVQMPRLMNRGLGLAAVARTGNP